MVRSMEVVLYMVLSTAPRLRVRRDHERRGAVRIHVIRRRSARRLPDTKMAVSGQKRDFETDFDELPQRVIVIGQHGERRDLAGRGSGGVIVAKPHEDQLRHLALCLDIRPDLSGKL